MSISFTRYDIKYSVQLVNNTTTILAKNTETKEKWKYSSLKSESSGHQTFKLNPKTLFQVLENSIAGKMKNHYTTSFPKNATPNENIIICINIIHEISEICSKTQIKLEYVDVPQVDLLKKRLSKLNKENNEKDQRIDNLEKKLYELEKLLCGGMDQLTQVKKDIVQLKDKNGENNDGIIKEDSYGGIVEKDSYDSITEEDSYDSITEEDSYDSITKEYSYDSITEEIYEECDNTRFPPLSSAFYWQNYSTWNRRIFAL